MTGRREVEKRLIMRIPAPRKMPKTGPATVTVVVDGMYASRTASTSSASSANFG